MSHAFSKRALCSLAIFGVALFAVAALSKGRSASAGTRAAFTSTAGAVSTSVNIVNNSSRAISNIYLSQVEADDWSNDQLSDDASIAPGHSFNLANFACDQQQVKVISEDADGCFASTVVNCGASATWTITNDTARDCGN